MMSIVTGFAGHIRDALFDPSPRESIYRVKDAVAKELTALDSTAEIKSTEYFNHTFAPDFVMTWPDQIERRVYLRLAYDLEALTDGMALIDSNAPLIFGLTSDESVEAKSQVDAVIGGTDAMFTEPTAMEQLISRKEETTTASLLSNAIVQGGRGTFVAEDAVQLSEVVERGFYGASVIDQESTATAVSFIDTRLGSVQASRMTRVLQAVWEGSEGKVSDFPGKTDLTGRLTPESLRYLVKYMKTDDLGFWRRIGRKLCLSDLESLDFDEDSRNIQHLIRANLDVIAARAAVVQSDPLGIESLGQDEQFRWSRRGRHVTFEAPNVYAMLSSAKSELDDVSRDRVDAVSVEQFIERAEEFELVEITLEATPETVIAKTEHGAIGPDRLRRLSESVEGSGSVSEAIFATPSGKVTANLIDKTGTGVTRSNLLMADLLMTTIPVVSDFEPELKSTLAQFLEYEDTGGQLSLNLGEFGGDGKVTTRVVDTLFQRHDLEEVDPD